MEIAASYSTASESELLSRLVPHYLIEDPQACRFWQRGINDTYRVSCADDIYSLRLYRHGLRSREEIDFEIAALNYLNERGAKVARPIAKRNGEYVSEVYLPEGLRYAVVTTHALGSEPDYDDVENGRLFGASVAELHRLSDEFETEHVRSRLEVDYLLDASLGIIKPFLQNKEDWLTFVDEAAAELRRAVNSVAIESLDVGFCHGDCHGCNVHKDEGLLTHFDFDCCGFGFRVFELATFKWGILGDDNESELWSSFLEGYRSEREIGDEDFSLIDTFVVIRQIWWMALIMGNARDFGHRATSDEFIDHQLGKVRKLMKAKQVRQVCS